MEEELGKHLLIRGTKASRKITLTEEGMSLQKRAEEILYLVKKAENEVALSNQIVMGDIYIGTGETDAVHILAKLLKSCRTPIQEFITIFRAVMPSSLWNAWIRDCWTLVLYLLRLI